jgi:hypothetical protein
MTDAQFEGDGPAYMVYVLAPNYDKAIIAIKGMFKGCRPRKFKDFTLVNEENVCSLGTKIIGYPCFYYGFEQEDEEEEEEE